MTKRAIFVGLLLAVVVLGILFAFFKPEQTEAPSNSTQPIEDSTADFDAELDSINEELNSETEIDLNGL